MASRSFSTPAAVVVQATLDAHAADPGAHTDAQPHINDPAGGITVDSQAREAINAILDVLEAAGLMEP